MIIVSTKAFEKTIEKFVNEILEIAATRVDSLRENGLIVDNEGFNYVQGYEQAVVEIASLVRSLKI